MTNIALRQCCHTPASPLLLTENRQATTHGLAMERTRGSASFPVGGKASSIWTDLQAATNCSCLPELDCLDIVDVWTQNASPSNTAYIGQFWHYLHTHGQKLGPQTVIAGDLNSNAIWDKPRRMWNHTTCVSALDAMGFRSLYHLATGERQGGETQPTFLLHRSNLKPYHIDYVFAHEEMLQPTPPTVRVGTPAEWINASDHMPLIVDLPDNRHTD